MAEYLRDLELWGFWPQVWIFEIGLTRAELNARSTQSAVAEIGAEALASRNCLIGKSCSFALTNSIETMMGSILRVCRNVKRRREALAVLQMQNTTETNLASHSVAA